MGSEEITDFGHLTRLANDENKKNQLTIKLKTIEAKDLLEEYLDSIKQFIQKLR